MTRIRSQTHLTFECPPYGVFKFARSSQDWLDSLQAFDYAVRQGMRLQSLHDAMAARVALYNFDKTAQQGVDRSGDSQKTSTVSLKWNDDGCLVSGFAELEDDDLTRKLVEEGCAANDSSQELIKPRGYPIVSKLIKTARKCPIIGNGSLQLCTKQREGKSEYGSNDVVVAAVGSRKVAELHAGYLNHKGRSTAHLLDFTETDVEELLMGKEESVLIRPVDLLVADCSFGADEGFIKRYRARGFDR